MADPTLEPLGERRQGGLVRRTRAGRALAATTVRSGPRGRPDVLKVGPDGAAGPRSRRPPGRIRGGGAHSSSTVEAPSVVGLARWRPRSQDQDLLASLLDARLPLVDTIGTLAEMSDDPRTRAAAEHIQRRVRSGGRFSVALAELSVPGHIIVLIDAGEQVGALAEALRGSARLTSRMDALRAEMRRALVYPAVVMAVGAAILAVIAVAVVPPLERTFLDLGGELPRITRLVLAVSAPLRSPTTVGAGLAAVLLMLLRRRIRRDRARRPKARLRGARRFDAVLRSWVARASEQVPLIGPLRRQIRSSVIASGMATLLRGGVPLADALRSVGLGLGHLTASRILDEAARITEEGRSPFACDVLRAVLDPAELSMLSIGERNGLLAEQWERVAVRREVALEGSVRRLAVVFEPLLVVLVGAIVGGAVLALYLPTFQVLDLL
jgi:type IV pilus assembly protein PilC